MKLAYILLLSLLFLSACASRPNSDVAAHTMDKDAIKAVILGQEKEFNLCYTSYLKTKSGEGKMVIEWVITPSGNVEKVKALMTPFKDDVVFNCVSKLLQKSKFPPAPEGKEAVVSYPFIFTNR